MAFINVAGLLEHGEDDRKLRAYAYLNASFRDTPDTSDVIDCLLPFLSACAAQQAGQFLDLNQLSLALQTLGLRIPIYAIQQLVPRLQALGIVEWNHAARRHLCVLSTPTTVISSNPQHEINLEESFGRFEAVFKQYALTHGVLSPPLSATWSDALITFLRSDAASEVLRTVTIRDTMIGDAVAVETFMVARFIQDAQANNNDAFNVVVQIYTGVLIEDFINNIQSVGDTHKYNQLSIYYDTTILLRLLGTSGRLYLTASMEMHRALQDLGCKCFYLDYTGDELTRILAGIIAAHEVGNEIFNETSEAIINGEIGIAQIKDFKATFEQRLGELNIFPFSYHYPSRKQEEVYQIDERGFVTALVAEAAKRDRSYKEASAINDARAVAIIMRLRKGLAKRSLSSCGHIFVSRNTLLQGVAKRAMQRDVEGYEGPAIPPVLTVGQITTVAWLATARALEPIKVTKELLAACYNAVRPSLAWTQAFSQALDSYRQENPGIIEGRADAALFLQTARNTARDESLNQTAVLKKANLAAIFAEAAAAAEAAAQERQEAIEQMQGTYRLEATKLQEQALERQQSIANEAEAQIAQMAQRAEQEREEFERQASTIRAVAASNASNLAIAQQRQDLRTHRKQQALRGARIITNMIRFLISSILGILLILFGADFWETGSSTKVTLAGLFGLLFVLANIDLAGAEVVAAPVRQFQKWLARRILSFLTRLDPYDPESIERIEPKL